MRFVTVDKLNPSRITSWYDTDLLDYDENKLPLVENRILISEAIWHDHFVNEYIVENGMLVLMPMPTLLENAIATANSKLINSCNTHITSGFYSNALGSKYFYPNNSNDQSNLYAASICAMQNNDTSFVTKLWCKKDAWAFTDHNETQILQVITSSRLAVEMCQMQLVNLKIKLNLQTTVAAANAVVWENPTMDTLV